MPTRRSSGARGCSGSGEHQGPLPAGRGRAHADTQRQEQSSAPSPGGVLSGSVKRLGTLPQPPRRSLRQDEEPHRSCIRLAAGSSLGEGSGASGVFSRAPIRLLGEQRPPACTLDSSHGQQRSRGGRCGGRDRTKSSGPHGGYRREWKEPGAERDRRCSN